MLRSSFLLGNFFRIFGYWGLFTAYFLLLLLLLRPKRAASGINFRVVCLPQSDVVVVILDSDLGALVLYLDDLDLVGSAYSCNIVASVGCHRNERHIHSEI